MAASDPVADLLTRIRNAGKAEHKYVDIPWSKLKESIVTIMKREGYVGEYNVRREAHKATIRVNVKYAKGRQPMIRGLKRLSRPGRRLYVAKDQIPYVLDGMGMAILSTSSGVKTDDEARKAGVGGELLCSVW